jgi:hypothetical protein
MGEIVAAARRSTRAYSQEEDRQPLKKTAQVPD